MQITERLKSRLIAISVGGVAGALLGLLLLGAFHLLGGGVAVTRDDYWEASALVLALSTTAGLLYGYQAFTES
jgi:hypothetical protein